MKLENTEKKFDWKCMLWVIAIVFLTDTSYISMNANLTISNIADLTIIILTLLCVLQLRYISKKIVFISGSMLMTICLTGSVFRLTYYAIIFSIWFCYYFSKQYSIYDFSKYYLLLMRVVAIGSLVCWIAPQYFVNISFFPLFTSSVGAKYRFLGFTTIPFLTHMQRRNFGPFWEPGTYQIYLCLAIFLLLFVSKKKNRIFDVILFCIVEITTLSGAAIIPVGLMFAAFLLKEKNIRAFLVVLIGCLAVGIMFESGMFDSIMLKMQGQDSNSTFLYRWIGFEGGIRNFLEHPFFGASFDEAQALRNELGMKYLGNAYGSNTNTFANFFGSFGAYVGLFFLISSYSFFGKICQSRFVTMIAFLGYFFSTSNENMTGSLLIIVIAILGCYGQLQNEEYV